MVRISSSTRTCPRNGLSTSSSGISNFRRRAVDTSSLNGRLRYLKTGSYVIAIDDIKRIDYRKVSVLEIVIVTYDGNSFVVTGQDALEAILAIKPGVIEGVPSIKWIKYSWMFHNLFGHPFMQLCALVGLTRFGLWIHDSTVPSIRKIRKLP
jgi:hypothetical protein